ncbi:probable U3 small nucleolar RNA-associated protein 11 isoform X2 [Acropora millepora]|uniref:probable U3 small nucleolar RNA-associated protein 11 isoform X2 n=1 Tax=Acropora millepora TaxID=45264 RepID=UPI001CF2973E|nr:probable U3 small nucleolar RNA-associated protein 11 isoform X2 [Acropora millepora]
MATFEKAKKSFQKHHRERGQLESRKKFGLLEKHKDYVLRARDYHKKQNQLKALAQQALNRNPDEFYFNMINSKMENGVHYIKEKETKYTADALKLMKTQDLNYINAKRAMEAKKIEKLQSVLHMLGSEEDPRARNQHIVFVDSEKEVLSTQFIMMYVEELTVCVRSRSFDAAAHFDTAPELVTRKYNRPTMETLQNGVIPIPDVDTMEKLEKQRHRCYEELRERIEREKKMKKLSEELQLQRHLMLFSLLRQGGFSPPSQENTEFYI